jgi:hypothetical protein
VTPIQNKNRPSAKIIDASQFSAIIRELSIINNINIRGSSTQHICPQIFTANYDLGHEKIPPL